MKATTSTTLAFALVAGLFASNKAQALPLGTPGDHVPMKYSVNSDVNFEGIVALNNCSGSLVRLENSKDSDMALVFTNGHCVETGFTPAGQYISHKASSRRMNLMNSDASTAGTVRATEIVYSTMTKTDLTIYKLGISYADILSKYNVHPLTLSSAHPALQQPIEIVSGYWQRGYACKVDSFIPHMKEDQWGWEDSIRYSHPGCETIGGTSGSPVILAGTRTMVAINNTGNESGAQCTINNPCEVDVNGKITSIRGNAYAQQTYWVYSCLNTAGDLDLTVQGCNLLH